MLYCFNSLEFPNPHEPGNLRCTKNVYKDKSILSFHFRNWTKKDIPVPGTDTTYILTQYLHIRELFNLVPGTDLKIVKYYVNVKKRTDLSQKSLNSTQLKTLPAMHICITRLGARLN